MFNIKEIIKEYNLDLEELDKALYQMFLDLGMDDDGLIAIVIDHILASIYN